MAGRLWEVKRMRLDVSFPSPLLHSYLHLGLEVKDRLVVDDLGGLVGLDHAGHAGQAHLVVPHDRGQLPERLPEPQHSEGQHSRQARERGRQEPPLAVQITTPLSQRGRERGEGERGGRQRETERDRDRETETETDRGREGQRQRDRETETETDRGREGQRQRDRERGRWVDAAAHLGVGAFQEQPKGPPEGEQRVIGTLAEHFITDGLDVSRVALAGVVVDQRLHLVCRHGDV